ncbi:MAG: hypothetical protein NUV84_02940 [Candidatus Uhrbacteria bacterium]|nr:hypothetical protein [Candidatus Uhrbacteria bacterium]
MAHRDYFKQAQKRRYQSRSYRNPHLDGRKSVPWKLLGVVFGIVAILAGATGFFFSHGWFVIQRVEVKGVEYIPAHELESTITAYTAQPVLLFFRRSNRFLFSSEALSLALENQFALSSISIGLREGTIFIELKERTSNLFWKTQNRLFVVDMEGIVVREITDPEDSMLKQPNLKELPVFVDANDVGVTIGSPVLTPQEIENAFNFFTSLKNAGIAYTYIELDRLAGKWVQLMTEAGYSILFDLTGNIDEQFRNLSVVLQEQIDDPTRLEYIDLRFGDKVYYK